MNMLSTFNWVLSGCFGVKKTFSQKKAAQQNSILAKNSSEIVNHLQRFWCKLTEQTQLHNTQFCQPHVLKISTEV